MDPTNEILQRLAGMEATQDARTKAIEKMAAEQTKQGQQLARIETTLESTSPRCESHDKRLAEIERSMDQAKSIAGRVEKLEDSDGQKSFVTAIIGALATALVLAGKWLLSSGGGK